MNHNLVTKYSGNQQYLCVGDHLPGDWFSSLVPRSRGGGGSYPGLVRLFPLGFLGDEYSRFRPTRDLRGRWVIPDTRQVSCS